MGKVEDAAVCRRQIPVSVHGIGGNTILSDFQMTVSDPISRLQQAVDAAVGYAPGVRSRLLQGTEVLNPQSCLSPFDEDEDLHLSAVAEVDPAVLGDWNTSGHSFLGTAFSVSREEDGSILFEAKTPLGINASGKLLPLMQGLQGQLFRPSGEPAAEVHMRLLPSSEKLAVQSLVNIKTCGESAWGPDMVMQAIALPDFEEFSLHGDFYRESEDVVRGVSLSEDVVRNPFNFCGLEAFDDFNWDLPLDPPFMQKKAEDALTNLPAKWTLLARAKPCINLKTFIEQNEQQPIRRPMKRSSMLAVAATPSKHNKSRPRPNQLRLLYKLPAARKH
eukprot:TRINITY_DN96140_c0_g1_i1.p1 TRINITY_DN96140_c0_g1~~TRINITY_DN96140_c0_g1_i1.p1  ORF type:complete len:332 (+),score=61.55 TRINITY_DN96140_c0_g1_i1:66-1061(+)